MQKQLAAKIVLFALLLFFSSSGCKEQEQGGGAHSQDSTSTGSVDTISVDTVLVVPVAEEAIELTFETGTVAPGSAFHVFNCYNIEVVSGEFNIEKDIDYGNFEMTVMYADTMFARIMHYSSDTIRQKARFVKGDSNVPRKKMLISGFVDDNMQAWLLKELETIKVEKDVIPRERP